VAAAAAGVEKLVAAELVTVFRVNGGGGSAENCWLIRVVSMFRSSLLVFMARGVTLKNQIMSVMVIVLVEVH
jgi:hypothetical protein